MKKRILAWVLLLSLLLTACAPADPGTTGGAPTTPPTEPGGVSTDIPAATEPSIQIHYQRNDGAYNEWGFWIWEMGGDGILCEMNYADDFGGVAVYPLS